MDALYRGVDASSSDDLSFGDPATLGGILSMGGGGGGGGGGGADGVAPAPVPATAAAAAKAATAARVASVVVAPTATATATATAAATTARVPVAAGLAPIATADRKAASAGKEKISHACIHCQISHVVCDERRPCSRCVKRGMASTCMDGVRKRAKYLMDTPAIGAATAAPPPAPPPPPASGAFGSEAINLEYSFLSSMLNDPSALLAIDPSAIALYNAVAQASSMSLYPNQQNAPSSSSSSLQPSASQSPFQAVELGGGGGWGEPRRRGGSGGGDSSIGDGGGGGGGSGTSREQQQRHAERAAVPAVRRRAAASPAAALASAAAAASPTTASAAALAPPVPPPPPAQPAPARSGSDAARREAIRDVYAKVTQPYDYISGFHHLVKYIKERFDRKDIIRICRALIQFRPSFMAQIVNLSYEDLIFMEQCFQRTLLEFEKLTDSSGTPTVVWRRTGEIALVGKEFSLLTQWTRDDLLRRPTYIYELMDSASAVEYWERFASLSFDASRQSCMMTAVLLSPTRRPVPCSYCFTIRRDIFDVPLAIVGNFLPLFEAR
ncbi:hypothetical protein DFJ73DRAFT_954803 [Zopfochytrium polystomum]|nr:hypothetical protein DFJ73DRAFT_954803 [Zopfochytrium polystomum]